MSRAIPSPTLSGSNADCGQWYQVESGQDCGTIETRFSISLDDLYVGQKQLPIADYHSLC